MVMRNREAKQKPFNATLTDILQKIFNKLTKKLGSTDVEHLQIILANFSTFANCSDKLFHILLMNAIVLFHALPIRRLLTRKRAFRSLSCATIEWRPSFSEKNNIKLHTFHLNISLQLHTI